MQWNFPKFSKAGSNWIKDDDAFQLLKINAEIGEAMEAFAYDEGAERVIEEVLDVLHACETFLRNQPIDLVNEIRNEVIEKNQKRGYYNERHG